MFWIDGRRTRAAAEAPQRKRLCRSRATARRSSSFAEINPGGIIMNTAMARRLALGDRVVCVGKNQPSAPGTITRITANQVEVLWEGASARRYRRKQLHNLRHRKLICESPNPNEKPENCYCSVLPKGSGLCLPCYTRWLAGRRA